MNQTIKPEFTPVQQKHRANVRATLDRMKAEGFKVRSLRQFLQAAGVPVSSFRRTPYDDLRGEVETFCNFKKPERLPAEVESKIEEILARWKTDPMQSETLPHLCAQVGIAPRKIWGNRLTHLRRLAQQLYRTKLELLGIATKQQAEASRKDPAKLQRDYHNQLELAKRQYEAMRLEYQRRDMLSRIS